MLKQISRVATNMIYEFVVSNPDRQVQVIQSQLPNVEWPGLDLQKSEPIKVSSKITLEQLTLVQLYFTLGDPIRTCHIIEKYERIALVMYTPYSKPDPVLPIPLVDLGESYLNAVRNFAQILQDWSWWENQRGWGLKIGKRLDAIYKAIDQTNNRLTRSEVWYLKTQFALSAANPNRKN